MTSGGSRRDGPRQHPDRRPAGVEAVGGPRRNSLPCLPGALALPAGPGGASRNPRLDGSVRGRPARGAGPAESRVTDGDGPTLLEAGLHCCRSTADPRAILCQGGHGNRAARQGNRRRTERNIPDSLPPAVKSIAELGHLNIAANGQFQIAANSRAEMNPALM